ncbi:MAG: redox-regulated ATPase YchF [Gemmatimonadota bacterium]
MSKLAIGVVGLPNVGKSTLFRALTAVSVPAANYPFCTIDPNVGVVEVPDPRLDRLAELVQPQDVIATVVEFVDIAGLVKGASEGEGLGNKFLQNIREVDAIAHVIRCFEDEAVVRVGQDPLHDREVVEMELALSDLDQVARALDRTERRARTGDKDAKAEAAVLSRLVARLEAGEPARAEPLSEDDRRAVRSLNLLTLKPTLYVANVSEDMVGQDAQTVQTLRDALLAEDSGAVVVEVCAQLESDVLELDESERHEYLEAHGVETGGLDRLIHAGYKLLGLQTFFTVGEKEVRAWTLHVGAKAPEAAGEIHTDFEKGFIRAETIAYEDFVEAGSLKRSRELGKMRLEGKEYVVQDGDVMLFRAAP